MFTDLRLHVLGFPLEDMLMILGISSGLFFSRYFLDHSDYRRSAGAVILMGILAKVIHEFGS